MVRNFLSPFVEEIEPKMKAIIYKLEDLVRQKDVLGLKEVAGGESWEGLPTTSLVEESGIFGRDDDKEKIINLLLSDDTTGNENPSVIFLMGVEGIGKTTLAQLVYNDMKVNEHFDLKAWVCVKGQFYKSQIIFRQIIEAVTSSTCDTWNLNELELTLQETLKGKKFLLVLDDVGLWDNDWEKLSSLIKSWAPGSMVIVTTPNHHAASIMHPSKTHYLKELQDENCWSLFAKYAIQGNSDANEAQKVIGRQIIKKCKGNPSAIKTIGALLKSKVDVAEWEKVNCELSDLSNVEDLPTLILRYKDLPLHLKRCFAYCSIFPMNYVFEKRQLILLWMAEGLLSVSPSPFEGVTMEEVGDDSFRALQAISLFQPSSGDKSHFVMHPFANELANFVSWQFNFRLEADNCHLISNKTRHFSFLPARFDKFEKFEALYQANRLRTFLPLNIFPWGNYLAKEVLRHLLPELRQLRVLSLSHYDNVTELPESIGKIKYLRYLNISFTAIKRLPDSICQLWNLETLNLSGCQYLAVLPKDMYKLVNLRHLDITRTVIKEMPIQLGSLKYLQTLSAFIISKHSGAGIEELGKLANLRESLSILELQNVESRMDAMNINLSNKEYLKELILEWKFDTNVSKCHMTVLDSLQPHSNLTSLTINGYGGQSFPDWVGSNIAPSVSNRASSVSNIASLRLQNCKHCLNLPPLGQLHFLHDLFIVGFEGVVKVDREFYGRATNPFSALTVLRFKQMLKWEEWASFGVENEGRAFCQLKELYIDDCPMLIGGLPVHIPSLAKLEINKCPQLLASLSSTPNELKHVARIYESPQPLSSFSSTSDVREIRLTHCNDALLNDLPTGIQIVVVAGFNALESLPERIMDSNSLLQELRIYSCSSLMKLSTVGVPSKLKILEVKFCEKLELPMCMNYPSLERLLLTYSCVSLRSIQLELFPKLHEIKICGCRDLESLTATRQYESDLVTLEIRDCPYFVSFPEGGLRAPNLTSLCIINCGSLRSLPDKMQILLPSLRELHIEDCPEVEPFLEGGMPSYLKSISINNCDKLNASGTGRGLQKLPSLRHLASSDKSEDEKSFPKFMGAFHQSGSLIRL
jgi:hypothetical protein